MLLELAVLLAIPFFGALGYAFYVIYYLKKNPMDKIGDGLLVAIIIAIIDFLIALYWPH